MARQFPTGARPSPRHKLLAAHPHVVTAAPPSQYAVIPKQLDMWGNDQYGDCVSAEEAFAKACYAPEIFIPTATVTSWASKNGFLNGADLTEVMDLFVAGKGFAVGSQEYGDGAYQSVDYTNQTVLQSAISQGPVKIGIDSSALPSGAGNNQGWYVTGHGTNRNEDHCVALCGYGPAGWLYQQLGVALPSALQAATPGYLLYTWSTIGFVDFSWITTTLGEAWLRNPTTIGNPPLPGPTPPVPPVPPTPGLTASLTLQTSLPASTQEQLGSLVGNYFTSGPMAIPFGSYSVILSPVTPTPPPPLPPVPPNPGEAKLTASEWTALQAWYAQVKAENP